MRSRACLWLARRLVAGTATRCRHTRQAWERQKELVADVLAAADAAAAGSARNSPPPLAGALLLVQHPPVYTLGAGSSLAHLGFDPAAPPLPLFRTERGGEVPPPAAHRLTADLP